MWDPVDLGDPDLGDLQFCFRVGSGDLRVSGGLGDEWPLWTPGAWGPGRFRVTNGMKETYSEPKGFEGPGYPKKPSIQGCRKRYGDQRVVANFKAKKT